MLTIEGNWALYWAKINRKAKQRGTETEKIAINCHLTYIVYALQ